MSFGIIDKDSGAEVKISYEHHRIHTGNHFYICNFEVVNSDASIYFGVRTPADPVIHMTFVVSGSSQMEFYVYEDATFTGGTNTIPLNNNRNNANTSSVVVRKNPTVAGGATGTAIYAQSSGYAGATPQQSKSTDGIEKRDKELELKVSTDYIFQLKSKDDANILNYCGEWYELVE
jgi:hypothetical protein